MCTCLRCNAPRLLALVAHEPGPERALRPLLVVSPAPESDVLHRRSAPARHFIQVIKFQKCARRASVTGIADKSALALIPLPNGALDVRRNVAAAFARG